ncbi:MAG: hypothetical protein ABSD98_10370 [Candidatus Korobacteraceae bacterium]|jgi:hypothetical protein
MLGETVSTAEVADRNHMNVTVTCATEPFSHKSKGHWPAEEFECSFASLEEAKAAPHPKGCVWAFIKASNDQHVYSPRFGWELLSSAGL